MCWDEEFYLSQWLAIGALKPRPPLKKCYHTLAWWERNQDMSLICMVKVQVVISWVISFIYEVRISMGQIDMATGSIL
jgi:hypothetical protein